MARGKPIETPRDLLHHQLIHEDDVDNWRVWLAQNDVHDEVELSGPRLWQGHLTLDAARRGRGVALTNHFVAAEDLAAGRLIDVGADKTSFKPIKLWAYMFVARADRWDYPPIERFRHWLLSTIAKEAQRSPQGRLNAAS
jgi:DNA-binding transcriptional LysR family regulator